MNHEEAIESLSVCLGTTVRQITKVAKQTSVLKFHNLGLFTRLVLQYFLCSPSMGQFYAGLCMVKNLLRNDPESSQNAIMEYEECCIG